MIKTTLAWIAALSCTAVPSFAAGIGYNVQTVSFPGDNFTQLLGINDSDSIVGYHGATVNKGFTLTLPSNRGQLVGFATINDSVVGFVATPVPEPASWTPLGTAGMVLMLGAMLRRRRAKEDRAISEELHS